MKAFLLTLLILAGTLSSRADDKVIVVTGVAEKALDPNLVHMTVEIWSKAATAKQAQAAAANLTKHTKKVFDSYKLKKDDVQTDQYSLNPEYIYDNKSQQNRMVGFRVVHSMSVILRKVDEAGSFLDALISDHKDTTSGVNVNSINWDSDKRAATETEALADAVKAAKIKADEIAKAAGVKIKGVSRITHTPGASNEPRPMARAFAMKAMDSASTELSGGQIKVRVEVIAEYEL